MQPFEKIPKKTKGGVRINSGRKPGSPNKKTAEVQRQVAESGITPLEYLLTVMRTSGDERMRMSAAQAAAPYVHAKLSNIELNARVAMHEASLDDLA